MAYAIKTVDNKLLEYDIRVPKREELQQVIDMVNDDNWNMSVDILTDVYDRQTQGFRAAVDREGNVLGNILYFFIYSLQDIAVFYSKQIFR